MEINTLKTILIYGGYNKSKVEEYIQQYLNLLGNLFLEVTLDVLKRHSMELEYNKVILSVNKLEEFYRSGLGIADKEKEEKLINNFYDRIKGITDINIVKEIELEIESKMKEMDQKFAERIINSFGYEERRRVIELIDKVLKEVSS